MLKTVLVVLSLVAVLVPAGVGAADPAPLVFYGDQTLAPFEFLEGGEPRGASVDMTRAISRTLGRPIEVRLTK